MAVYTLSKTSGGSTTSEKNETVKITLPKNGSTARSYTLTGTTSQGKTATITITQRAYIDATAVSQIVSKPSSSTSYITFDNISNKDITIKFQIVKFPTSASTAYLFNVASASSTNGVHFQMQRSSSTALKITCLAGNSYSSSGGSTFTVNFSDSDLDSTVYTLKYERTSSKNALTLYSDQKTSSLLYHAFAAKYTTVAPRILNSTTGTGIIKILSVTIGENEFVPAEDSSGNVGVWNNGDFYSGDFLVDYEPAIDLSSISAKAAGGTYTIKITDPDSIGWQLSSDDSNVTFSKTSGTGAATVTVTVAENTALSQRTATISLAHGANSSKVYDTCALTQEARAAVNPSITETSYSATADGGSTTINVVDNDNVGWKISADSGITISDYSSSSSYSGSKTITLTIAANKLFSPSSPKVYLKSTDGNTTYDTFTVSRPSATKPAITESSVSATAAKGTYTINITDPNSVGWALSSSSSNVTFSKTSGTGAAKVTVTVAANTSTSSTSYTITLKSLSTSVDTCSVSQEGREKVNPSMTLTYGSNTGLSSASIPRTETQVTVVVTDSDNVGWYITPDSGVTLSNVSTSELQTGSKSITATVSANTSTSQKTLHIYLLSEDGDTLYTTLTLTQAAVPTHTFTITSVSPSNASIKVNGSAYTVGTALTFAEGASIVVTATASGYNDYSATYTMGTSNMTGVMAMTKKTHTFKITSVTPSGATVKVNGSAYTINSSLTFAEGATITVTATASGYNDYSATYTMGTSDMSKTISMTVTTYTFKITSVSPTGATITVNNSAYTVGTSLTFNSGTSVTVKATAAGYDDYSKTYTISSDTSDTISMTASNPSWDLTDQTLDSGAHTITVHVIDKGSKGWKIMTGTYTITSGTGDKTYTYNLSANTTTTTKTNTIKLTSSTGSTTYATAVITQQAASSSTTSNPYFEKSTVIVSLENTESVEVMDSDSAGWQLYFPEFVSGDLDNDKLSVDINREAVTIDEQGFSDIYYGDGEVDFTPSSECPTGTYTVQLNDADLNAIDMLALTIE